MKPDGGLTMRRRLELGGVSRSSFYRFDPERKAGDRDMELRDAIQRIALEEAVRQLPPGCRTVFLLHDVEGCEHHEIAERLGCSVGNSKSQLHKARMRLRILLG